MDNRDAREEEHLAPWLEENPNKGVGTKNRKPQLEKVDLADGLTAEDFKLYELQDIHLPLANPRISKLNQEILKKVNHMVEHWVDYKRAVAHVGLEEERALAVKNVTNLRKQAEKLQVAVTDSGGTSFKIP